MISGTPGATAHAQKTLQSAGNVVVIMTSVTVFPSEEMWL